MSRIAGPLALTLGLATLVPLFGDGAAHAEPTPDCAEAYPVTPALEGRTVHGLTVAGGGFDDGTTPGTFTGEVLGVLDDGIAPGLDMVMMRLESPAIGAAGGIWQGMSGSPVYDDETGDLIGAVAYGLAWGTTPVAGVTPFADMDDYLEVPPLARKVDVTRAEAKVIAETGEATVAQAEQGFRHLPVPVGISGVSTDRLDKAKNRPYINKNAAQIGSASSSVAADETLVAGGNLAALQSVGDVTYAGVGTVTSVCNGRLVGFGHPMAFAGNTSLGLAAADTIYVQEDPVGVPFKVANIGDLGGTITDDRLAGIAGFLGESPTAVLFTSDITFRGENRVGETDVLVQDVLASIAFSGSLGNHDRVLDSYTDGSETQKWLIEGTDPSGDTFEIEYSDRYQSSSDIAVAASYDLADVLWILGSIEGVEISSVTSTGVVSDDSDQYSLRKIEQKVGGKWVNVTRDPAKVKAGNTLRLRMTLKSGDSTKVVPLSVDIPRRLAGSGGSISLIGGNDAYSGIYEAQSFEDVIKVLRNTPRNDEVVADIRIGRGDKKLRKTVTSAPQSLVVSGFSGVDVIVRR